MLERDELLPQEGMRTEAGPTLVSRLQALVLRIVALHVVQHDSEDVEGKEDVGIRQAPVPCGSHFAGNRSHEALEEAHDMPADPDHREASCTESTE